MKEQRRSITNEGRLTYTAGEGMRLLGVGRAAFYAAVAKGQIPSIRIGRRLLIPRAALDRMFSEGSPYKCLQPPQLPPSPASSSPTLKAAARSGNYSPTKR